MKRRREMVDAPGSGVQHAVQWTSKELNSVCAEEGVL